MSNANRQSGPFEHIDWKLSAVFGACAWVVGLLLSYLTLSASDALAEPGAGDESTLDVAAWLYFEAIGGAFDLEGEQLDTVGLYTYELLETNTWGLYTAAHYLLPPIVLVVAGYVLAGRYKRGDVDGVSNANPLQIVLGGASLAAGFAAAVVVGLLVFDGDAVSYDFIQALLVAVCYPLAFATLGAGIRSSVRTLGDPWGWIGGVGAFVAGLVLWNLLEDPFGEESPLAAESFSDLSGTTEHVEFLFTFFLDGHGFGYDELLPEWYVMVAITGVAAAIVYRAETSDWLVGAGKGARLAVGYVVVTLIVTLGYFGLTMSDLLDQDAADRETLVQTANVFFGALSPRMVFVYGVIWVVAFGALGGALGAKAVETQESGSTAPATGGEPAE